MPRLMAIVARDYPIRLIRSPLRWRSCCGDGNGGTLLKSRRLGRLVDGGDGFCHLFTFSSVLLERKKRKEKILIKERTNNSP